MVLGASLLSAVMAFTNSQKAAETGGSASRCRALDVVLLELKTFGSGAW